MKICICCSLSCSEKVCNLAKQLQDLGHEVLLPNGIIHHLTEQADFDPVQAKIETNSCKLHIDKIRDSDAVLVCNYDKNDIPNYIGANSFAEMFVAHYFDKPIYCLNPLPNQAYIDDELKSFQPIILDGDLSKINHK